MYSYATKTEKSLYKAYHFKQVQETQGEEDIGENPFYVTQSNRNIGNLYLKS